MFNSPARQEFFGHVFVRLRYRTWRDHRITTKLQDDTSHFHQHINEKNTPFCVTENQKNNEVKYIFEDTETQQHKVTIEDQVASALSLDLKITPRAKRNKKDLLN